MINLVHPTQLYTIGTTDGTTGVFTNVLIETVIENGCIVLIRQGNDPIMLPICKIVGIAGDTLDAAPLVEPPDEPRGGECACCEAPWREYFDTLIGSGKKVTVDTQASGIFETIEFATVMRTGEGIVILRTGEGVKTRYSAVSLCQITAVKPLF